MYILMITVYQLEGAHIEFLNKSGENLRKYL